jgi:hypothetical protein
LTNGLQIGYKILRNQPPLESKLHFKNLTSSAYSKPKDKLYKVGNSEETWAWSYQQKFSDLRNFQKNSENFKAAIFVIKV